MDGLTQRIIEYDLPAIFTSEDLKKLESAGKISYYHLKEALEEGNIMRIRRGIYAINRRFYKKTINPSGLAQKINSDSYISFESALRNVRWIPEHVTEIMSASLRSTYVIKTEIGWYSYRKIMQKNLFAGVQKVNRGGSIYLEAKPLKALADYVYDLKYRWDTIQPLVESLRIERENLEQLTGADFDEIQGNYEESHVERFLSGIRKELQV